MTVQTLSSTAPQVPSKLQLVLTDARAAKATALDEYSAKRLLADLGVRVPKSVRIDASEPVAPRLDALTPPFALKALSSTALHKSDIGAVRLSLTSLDEVETARAAMAVHLTEANVALTGFLVEEMAAPGVELVVGGTVDPQLGPMLMVGAGGIYAEILDDVSFRLCPISAQDAHDMLSELKISSILQGARGRASVDRDAIVALLMTLGGPHGFFTANYEAVCEFDLNPVFARPDGAVAVDARFVLNEAAAPHTKAELKTRESPACEGKVLEAFRPLFEPRTIAVAGASAKEISAGNRFIRCLRDSGYKGTIYPIHPTGETIEGLPAFKSIAATPTSVDYAYLTLPARQVAGVFDGARGRLKFAQVMSSAAPDVERDWEQQLIARAGAGGFRVIGPNCMGTHTPRGRMTFMEGVGVEQGPIGIACQSGGLSMDILRRGQALGLRFSGVVSLGNSLDIGTADLLEFYLADSMTNVVGLYVEDVKDGPRFRELVRRNGGRKPIVLLVGGATTLGQKAAASHTGAIGSTSRAWDALARQSGLIMSQTLNGFLDALQLCCWLKPKRLSDPAKVILFGNGGGSSVLATDAIARAKLDLAILPDEALAECKDLRLPPGASLVNPIDIPASVLQQEQGRIAARILDIARRHARPHALIVHLNLAVILNYRHVPDFMANLIEVLLGRVDEADTRAHLLLVLRSDGSEEVDAWKRKFRTAAAAAGVATFDEIPQAVEALAAFSRYERFLSRRDASSQWVLEGVT